MHSSPDEPQPAANPGHSAALPFSTSGRERTPSPPEEVEASSARLPKRIQALLILLFVTFLWLPALDSLFHLDHAPLPNEKRRLADFPEYHGLRQLKPFLAGLENYFSDHFGFRKRLVRTYNHWRRQIFREGGNNVTLGREGWLFRVADKMIEEYTGLSRFSDQDLRDWQDLLERRRDWLAQRGCQYLFVVPPDKHSVYPEYLPDWLIKSDKPSKVQQLVQHMKNHSTVPVLDLCPSLLEAKPQNVLYQMTDTHWNYFGGFIGCEAVVKTLACQIPGLKPLPPEAFAWRPVIAPAGDLANVLGDSSVREQKQFDFSPRPPLEPLRITTEPTRLASLWVTNAEPKVSRNAKASGKAIVFRDSFAVSWYPFLGYHFKEVVYIWRYSWDQAFLEREKPEVVIDEMLERFFNKQNPRELLTKDHLE